MDNDSDEESEEEEIKQIPIGGPKKRAKVMQGDSDGEYGMENDDSMSEDEEDKKIKAKRDKK